MSTIEHKESPENVRKRLHAFCKEFKTLVREAARSGLPLQNLILELETEKFRLQLAHFDIQAAREAAEITGGIVPAPAGLDVSKLPKNFGN